MTVALRPRPADGGQASVELVLVLPLVVLAALAIVQVGVVVHHQVLVSHVAREAARASAVSGGRLGDGAVPGLRHGLDRGRLEVRTGPPDAAGHVTATVRYHDPTDVALVGRLLPTVTLTSTVVMRAER